VPNLVRALQALPGSPRLPDVLDRRTDGILEWSPAVRPLLNAHVAHFFAARNDDSSASGVIDPARQKFAPVRYATPTVRDMAVILVYFNVANYARPIQNLLTVKHFLETADIPFYLTELAVGDAPFLFRPADNLFQVRSASAMFYKENLIRYTEARIPATFTKICILDGDVLFDDPDWYSTVSTVLNTHTVVQPFNRANWLDIDFTISKTANNGFADPVKGHPGFACAFDRAFFDRFALEDRCVSSPSGDTILRGQLLECLDPANRYFKLFNTVSHSREGLRVGSVPFNAFHLNHGPLTRRNYFSITQFWIQRCQQLRVTNIDEFLVRRDDGILEWRPEFRSEFNAQMIAYFKSRQEDSGLSEREALR
jgi:hypothetical protein